MAHEPVHCEMQALRLFCSDRGAKLSRAGVGAVDGHALSLSSAPIETRTTEYNSIKIFFCNVVIAPES